MDALFGKFPDIYPLFEMQVGNVPPPEPRAEEETLIRKKSAVSRLEDEKAAERNRAKFDAIGSWVMDVGVFMDSGDLMGLGRPMHYHLTEATKKQPISGASKRSASVSDPKIGTPSAGKRARRSDGQKVQPSSEKEKTKSINITQPTLIIRTFQILF